jgi:hypothetical protein
VALPQLSLESIPRLAADPSTSGLVGGEQYWNTTTNEARIFDAGLGRFTDLQHASRLNSSIAQVKKDPGVLTATTIGLIAASAPTLAATVTSADDATGRWANHATGAVSGNASGISTTATITRPDWTSDSVFRVKLGAAADLLAVRKWVGLWSVVPATMDASATPAAHLAAFRYDTAADGTAFWRCVTAAGTATQTVTVCTGVGAIAAATAYDMRIRLLGTAVEFYINDSLMARHTTNLPVATGMLGFGVRVATLAAGAKSIKWGRVSIAEYA